jgi:hypothetical protein
VTFFETDVNLVSGVTTSTCEAFNPPNNMLLHIATVMENRCYCHIW